MNLNTGINEVKKLGNEIGYGHLMSIASALWRKRLIEMDVPESGAFIPMVQTGVKDDWLNEDEIKNYDNIIKKEIG